ncbi:uncharacterized protein LOC125870872 isoform X2 [Solanum stenotomum]|uniref:uncharacterized protein LOC125870872 isoform X2 n=1 Tax=Solanum stenotomum TaxID=172797 RepID=UPI0020D1A80D|nr:uncharacterized protein LOC125870872 isoform X2 [Solanum stenotomum]
MEIEDGGTLYKSKEKIFHTFSDFMLRITKFDELVEVGSRLLVGFQQGLEVHTSHLGLQNHVNEAKVVVDELACLLKEAEAVVQSINCSLAQVGELNVDNRTNPLETCHDEAEASSVDPLEHEITDIAIMMAVVYSMVKSDYTMQEKIVSSLNLTSPSGELESYSSMWSLRPYIDDEIMHKVWKFVR